MAPIPQQMRASMGYGAIALADVEYLRLHDNVIEDNGRDYLQPVCGFFVLHAAGLDICRNRIRNTGAKTDEDSEDAAPGHRGGIVVAFALPGIEPLEVAGQLRPRQNGVPAVRVHDNIVSHPLGQALSVQAIGPVTVQGNQLTSQGVIVRFQDPTFWASTVLIVNLGWSNEFYFQTFLFTGVTTDPGDVAQFPTIREGFTPEAQTGLDDRGIGRYMANGNVMFSDNQVLTDLAAAEFDFAISTTLILTLDDVCVENNQFDADFLVDVLFTNLLAVGMTVRIQNNRFKETLFITLFSSVGLGLLFNNTSGNHATHCLLNMESPLDGWFPGLTTEIDSYGNSVLFNAISFLGFWCEQLGQFSTLLSGDSSQG